MICTVTLNPAFDYVVFADKFLLGEINRSYREELHAGGKGINVSAVLKGLGVETCASGFVGGCTGEMFCKVLTETGIGHDFIQVQGMTRINVKVRSDQETDLNGTGIMPTLADLSKLAHKLRDLPQNSWVVMAGSVPRSLPADAYALLISQTGRDDLCYIADTSGEPLRAVLKEKPWLVKPNREELSDLYGIRIFDKAGAYRYAERLLEDGAQNAVVSLGGEGAVFVSASGQKLSVPAFSGKVVDTVGAGDALLAAFLAAKSEGKSDSDALKFGVAAGCATAFCTGLASKEEICALLSR